MATSESTRGPSTPPPQSHEAEIFKTFRYEETAPATPPIPLTIAPPRARPTEIHPALRSRPTTSAEHDVEKRDSGLAPTNSSIPRVELVENDDDNSSLKTTSNAADCAVTPQTPLSHPAKSNTPSLEKSDSTTTAGSENRWKINAIVRRVSTLKTPPDVDFSPITTPIPTNNHLDIDFMTDVEFSKRGSVLMGGQRVLPKANSPVRAVTAYSATSPLSEEIERESQKVRSLYETSVPPDWVNGTISKFVEDNSVSEELESPGVKLLLSVDDHASTRPTSSSTDPRGSVLRLEHELAGGLEDWEDVRGDDVDRYGFIVARTERTRSGTPELKAPHRVSTALQLASDTPRKRRGLGGTLSSSRSSKSVYGKGTARKMPPKSLKTQTTSASKRSTSRPFRSATNRLPGNQDRRWMEEAGDMLTLPPGLADIAEDEEGGKAAESIKRKEWDRAEKWRKMAKIVKGGEGGEGMQFEFDTRNPKLIERTWKGIPDRWRATAWHSFLSASAKKKPGSATDSEIVAAFQKLLDQGSADDVQIDMDVPRTINSHIMFRKRYRGGQRLLFRVLHCLSLYFPVTGYVQGMASLAATLLCYYDEEKAFVMLVRMWQLRGLEKLYEPQFPGLMAALEEFQQDWIGDHAVMAKLIELCIEPTSYGTRWYLTLFNYSIPFVAQLRVWDVFMLLGDIDASIPATKERPFQGGLDILHAAGTALIDGTREILMDSDFENAMKALTSWIPVKDEELFVRVTKAEWKIHHNKKRG